jgi:hypothetical protein
VPADAKRFRARLVQSERHPSGEVSARSLAGPCVHAGSPAPCFLNDDISIADPQWVAVDKLVGFRQITDAHLLGLALKNGAQLVTLDRGIVGLVPTGFDAADSVAVIL